MQREAPHCDADLLDLLRTSGAMGVSDLAKAMQVTPTAVRQRLSRLMGRRMIHRHAVRIGRGRPRHLYELTDQGLRATGSNFTDLALALWEELGLNGDEEMRKNVVSRIAAALASEYTGQIEGTTTAQRMQSLRELLAQRRIPVSIESFAQETVMTTHACPYPKLAEKDRSVCEMEEMLFSELLGQDVQLAACRLDGGSACEFHAK